MSEELQVLQTIRLKGRPTTDQIAAACGLDSEAVDRVLRVQAEAGRCTRTHGRHALAPAGRDRLRQLLAAERAGLDQSALARAYEDFVAYNTALKSLVTDWQLVDGTTVNDHSDAAYDAGIVERLTQLHTAFREPLAHLAGLAPRLGRYPRRLSDALAKVRAGDHGWLARPLIDSYHTVWFELHEELLGLTGRERVHEAAAGRAG